jgi:hypothetical protein
MNQIFQAYTHMLMRIGIFIIAGLVFGAIVVFPLKGWLLSKGMTRRTSGIIAQAILTLIMVASLVICMLTFAKAPPSP